MSIRSRTIIQGHYGSAWPKPLTWVWRFLYWFSALFALCFSECRLSFSSIVGAGKMYQTSIARTNGSACDMDRLSRHSKSKKEEKCLLKLGTVFISRRFGFIYQWTWYNLNSPPNLIGDKNEKASVCCEHQNLSKL